MFIGNIFELKGLLSQLNPLSRANQSTNSQATSATGSSSSTAGGSLSSAALQALAQIGVPGLQGTARSGSGSTSQQQSNLALQDFLQKLFAALQQQNVNTTGHEASVRGATATSGIKAHQHHHGGVGQELQNLLQQLSATGPSSANGAVPGSAPGNSSLSSLQASFSKLVAASGASGSAATLGNFLNAFARDLPGRAAAGNLVSTSA